MSAEQTPAAVSFAAPRQIDSEDQARADFYALIAALFARPPDATLLQAIAIASPPEGVLHAPWNALAAASAVITEDAVDDEYHELFLGVGRPAVMLYGSYYTAGFMMEKPLADLRDDLRKLGFERRPDVREPEDHLSAICEVMRGLILGDVSDRPADVAVQNNFFEKHLLPWSVKVCDAVSAYHRANFYRNVANLARAFFALEAESFGLRN